MCIDHHYWQLSQHRAKEWDARLGRTVTSSCHFNANAEVKACWMTLCGTILRYVSQSMFPHGVKDVAENAGYLVERGEEEFLECVGMTQNAWTY